MKKSRDIELSVAMPVFNGQRYLESAIDSILRQTFRRFEFIIIDDGSTDDSLAIIKKMARNDPRIRIIQNHKNLGVVKSLNLAFEASKGNYIARMDADDISLPTRLEKQLAAFYRDDCLVMVGTNCSIVGENLSFIGPTLLPLDDWSIRCLYLVMNPFVHSSVMLKGEIIRDRNLRYDSSLQAAIDYELWSRVLDYGTVCNLPDQLVFLRKHDRSFSKQYSKEQIDCFLKVRQIYWRDFIGGCPASDPNAKKDEVGGLDAQIDQVNPLNSIEGCKWSITLIKILKRRFPDEKMLSTEVYIKIRSIWVGIKSFKSKDARHLLLNIRVPIKFMYLSVTGHYLWRALQLTSRIRLIKYRWQYSTKIKRNYLSEH